MKLGAVISWLKAHGTRRTALVAASAAGAVLVFGLLALPAAWYIAWADADRGSRGAVQSELMELAMLDARWEREALQALTDFGPGAATSHAAAVADIAKRLEGAARDTPSRALQRGLPSVIRAYNEKAQLMERFREAHRAARDALRQTLAMEAEFAGVLRDVWHEVPDRQRLVAADNLVTQLLADAQRYYFGPADPQRKNLEGSTADLRGAVLMLPEAVKPAATRLETHVAELLRAKPQEQAALDRVRFHNAAPLAMTLARELREERSVLAERQERLRAYLAAYFLALLVLVAYLTGRFTERALSVRAVKSGGGVPTSDVSPAESSPPGSQDAHPEV